MATNPAANLKKGQKAWHPFRLFRDKDTQLFAEEIFDVCQEYLCHEAIADYCRNGVTVRNQFLTCKCLHILRDNDEGQEAVARYMVFLLNKSKPDRQQIIMGLLILLQFQDITCPHPGDKALAKIKSKQNTRVCKRQK